MIEAGDVISYHEVRDIRCDISTGRVLMQLEHSIIKTNLVIGVDGIHSIIRKHLLRPDKFSPRHR
jgi:2-polyprenyl-6-methoxyphenol hydroxylase-like FAD-dependent oxidoreductase